MKKLFAVFPDTNILLHFRPLDQIKWREVLGCDQVLVVVAPIVFNELDDKKWRGQSAKLRDRAARVARSLERYMGDEPAELRVGESILLSGHTPSVDFAVRGLDRQSNDDQLIASILAYAEQNPDHEVVLVSDDTGPRVKAHAHRIRGERLPEDHRLEDEPDRDKKALQELRTKLARIEAAQPALSIRFQNGGRHAAFRLDLLGPCEERGLEERVEAERQKWPKLSRPDDAPKLLPGDIRYIPDEEYDRYNADVDAYLKAYREYLRETWEYAASFRRRLTLETKLVNTGAVAAEDIDVALHFPDGFQVRDPNADPEPVSQPAPPREPVKPRNELGLSFRGIGAIRPASLPRLDLTLPDPMAPTIRRTNSYDVEFPTVVRLKQNQEQPLPPLEVTFDNDGDVGSFNFTYTINALDLPEDEEGRLDVIVEVEKK